MYTTTNYKTKKELKEAVAAGKRVTVFQPNADITGAYAPTEGMVTLEGPHYPAPHRWYAEAWLDNGQIVRVK